MLLLTIALGGALGAFLRFRLSGWIDARAGRPFPWGTLVVNAAGCFALGVVLPLMELDGAATPLRGLFTVGLLGAFTTFSTFAAELVELLREGRYGRAAGYVGASLGMGLAAIAAGLWVGGQLA